MLITCFFHYLRKVENIFNSIHCLMKKIVIAIFCMFLTVSLFSQKIEGVWSGSLNFGTVKLPIIIHITEKNNSYSATMDSPNQGAKGIPVSTIHFEHGKLSFSIVNIGASYEGTLQNDTVSGVFRQSGMELPLNLTRTTGEPLSEARPQDPRQPYPYNTEEVRFDNKESGITLAGTFSWPKAGGDFPVAVLVSGSGPQNRNEEILDHRPFLVLADYLTRNGIAVLRYDDRGVAESGGNYATATLDDFATDALSAVNYLKMRKEINPRKIGVIGHSEGGTIAFMLAGEPKNDLAFIVSMAGMSIPGDSLLRMQRYLLANKGGVPDEVIAQNEIMLDKANDIVKKYPKDYILQNIQSLADEALPDALKGNEVVSAQFQEGIQQLMNPEIQSLMNCNPANALKGIKCPVLALGGEKDLQVPAEVNLNRIKALVKSPVTIRKYPDLNHLFQHCITGHISEYSSIEETISPEVLNDIATWIMEVVRK